MKVALIGATGLVGREIVERLLADHEVVSLTRRASGFEHERLREHVGPMEGWGAALADERIDVAISALGTTRRAAGSREKFEAIDLDAVVGFARAAKAAGARQVIAVSSVGANPLARNFYLRTKGRMERALGALGLDRVDLLRPGLLRGRRSKVRPGERVALIVSPFFNLLLVGRLSRFAAIDAGMVARAGVALVGREGAGVHTHENRAIRALATAR